MIGFKVYLNGRVSRHFAVATTLETPSPVKDISGIHVLLEVSDRKSAVL